jgi:hypothetical protein
VRQSNLEKMRAQLREEQAPITVDGIDGMHALLLNGGTKPVNPTQRELLYAQEEMLAYLGMVGAAKTSAGCSLMWMLMLFEPGYRCLIGRKDYNDLKNTTMERMTEMLRRLPPGTLLDRDKSAPATWYIKPLGNTSEVSTCVFMGLHERPSSYEFHGAFVDEADEVPQASLSEVASRCRLPGKTRKIVIAFNPPDEDHYLYSDCTGLDTRGNKVLNDDGTEKGPVYRLLVPSPGENEGNLVAGYYNSLRKSMPADMVARLVEGKWGSSLKGKPVYGSAFKRDFHVKARIPFNPREPLILMHDWGYRAPYTLWCQQDARGVLKALWEDYGKEEEIHDRAPRIMALTQMRTTAGDINFTGDLIHWGDPAAKQHKDTGSTLAVLHQNGIMLKFNHGVGIEPGLRAVRHLLGRAVMGEAAFQISKEGCPVLIRTLEKGYRYPDVDEAGDPNKPKKDNVYDNPADAFRYGVVGLYGPVYLPNEKRGEAVKPAPTIQQIVQPTQRILEPGGVAPGYGWRPDGDSAEYDPRADPFFASFGRRR